MNTVLAFPSCGAEPFDYIALAATYSVTEILLSAAKPNADLKQVSALAASDILTLLDEARTSERARFLQLVFQELFGAVRWPKVREVPQ